LKSALVVSTLIRVTSLGIDAAIGFDVFESIVHESSLAAIIAVTSGAIDEVLFAE